MKCPECGNEALVKDSRENDGDIIRRRECKACGYRFNTVESFNEGGKIVKRYVSKYVMCPFYHNEDALIIYCEGVTDGTVIHLAFNDKDQKKDYKKEYCCTPRYEKCLLCKMLNSKY
jgi:hypothetical protein